RLQQADLHQQIHRERAGALEFPVTILKGRVFPEIRAAVVKDGALAQDAVHEPAFFQLKYLFAKSPAFISGNCHAASESVSNRIIERFSHNPGESCGAVPWREWLCFQKMSISPNE